MSTASEPRQARIAGSDSPESGAEHAGPRPVAVAFQVTLTALAHREEDGRYSVFVPVLPGCYTDADSLEEVAAMIRESAEGWIAARHDQVLRQEKQDP